MRRLLQFNAILILLFVSMTVGAQEGKLESDVEMGVGFSQQKYMEIETQLEQGLPNLLENIKDAGTLLKKDQVPESLEALKRAQQEIARDEKVLGKERQYVEMQTQADKIEAALNKAEVLIKGGKKNQALKELTQAYRRTQAMSKSPVLKLAATEIALGNASRQIQSRNYRSAGLFLQQAIDNITVIQNDPRVNQESLNRLKNDIIIVQQQVGLGKLQDEKRLKRFYPGLAAARVNALNAYYDVWSRTDMPWDQY